MPSGPKLEQGTQRVAVPGGEVVIDVRGTGPLCFAHPGGPGLDSSYLHDAALEKHFTVIYVDPLGTGSSSKLEAPAVYSLQRDVEVVEALRGKLGIDKACLIGHSYGGEVVLSYAVAHPDRVRGMLVYSATPTTEPEFETQMVANMAWFADQPWHAAALAAAGEFDTAPDEAALNVALEKFAPIYFADYSGRRADLDPVIKQMRVSFEVTRRRPQGKQGRYDVRGKFGRLHTTPVMIVTGERDFMTGPDVARWIQQSIADSKLVVIPQAGHFAHVEQPAAFDAVVGQFAQQLR